MPADGTRQQSAIATSRRWLDVVFSGVAGPRARAEISAETLENFASYVNRGFLRYRKAVAEAADHAAIEWDGQGSIVRDLSGRALIDCLGGSGVYSAGIKHPKIVSAVARQLGRMRGPGRLLRTVRGATTRTEEAPCHREPRSPPSSSESACSPWRPPRQPPWPSLVARGCSKRPA
jgi:hypothetical protein